MPLDSTGKISFDHIYAEPDPRSNAMRQMGDIEEVDLLDEDDPRVLGT